MRRKESWASLSKDRLRAAHIAGYREAVSILSFLAVDADLQRATRAGLASASESTDGPPSGDPQGIIMAALDLLALAATDIEEEARPGRRGYRSRCRAREIRALVEKITISVGTNWLRRIDVEEET